MDENEITGKVIKSAIAVHRVLGPGLLENAYKECLFYTLTKDGLLVEKEKVMPVVYEGIRIDCGYRMDLLVEHKVVIELKSVVKLSQVHMAQLLTYLRLGDYRVGLLINFNVLLLKDGIERVVNRYEDKI